MRIWALAGQQPDAPGGKPAPGFGIAGLDNGTTANWQATRNADISNEKVGTYSGDKRQHPRRL